MKVKLSPDFSNIREFRLSLSETQTVFWGRFGIAQSCGSRYENAKRVAQGSAKILIMAYALGEIGEMTLSRIKKAMTRAKK